MAIKGIATSLVVLALGITGCAFTTVGPATDLTHHSAILQGGIGSLERTTGEWGFEWGKTTEYGNRWIPLYVRFPPDAEVASVSFPIADLEAGTTYHYRLCARNKDASGQFCSRDRQFVTPTTAPAAPKVYLTELCGLDGSPDEHPSYAVMRLVVGLPQGETLTTLDETDGTARGSSTGVVGPDGLGAGVSGFGPAQRGGTARTTVFEDLDGDHFVVDPGEPVHAQGTIEDICADFAQEP